MKYRSRFTIVELLVVIVIIAILSSLLLPALHGAAQRAEGVYCTGNIRQLQCAFELYASDNGMRFPPYVRDSVYGHGGTNWARYTREYYSSVKLLDCPASPQAAPEDTVAGLHLYDGNYGWNYDGLQGNRGNVYSLCHFPSECHALFDSGDQCVIYGANNWDNLMEELDLDWESRSEGCNRHRRMVNVACLDGHALPMPLHDFIAAPCKSNEPPWMIEWEGGMLQQGTVPFPLR